MRRLLLFDVDGTLLDVDGAGRAAFRSALVEVYGDTGPIDDFAFSGKTDPLIARGLLRHAGWSDPDIERGLEELWEAYLPALERELAARASSIRVYPGVRELLGRLVADARFELALVTGNVREGAFRKLAAAELDAPFRYGAFGSDAEARDELPPVAVRRARERNGDAFEARDVWVIGDTPADVRCAKASGYRALAVATGGYEAGELAGHGADRVLDSLADTDVVLRLLGS